jgi:ABC-2 type transport system permease protein
MINAFRYGFLGVSDVQVGIAFAIMVGATAALFVTAIVLLDRGYGIRE